MFPIQIRYTEAIREILEMTGKATQNLSQLRESQVQYGSAPKETVYHEDNIVLYHYKPVVEQPFKIPLLIVYALVNRPYMVDLQENRSLVRSLLKLGIDVYLIDWGYPQRNDRWLTIEDHVNGYIDNCMCYASLHPEKVCNLIVMVAPVDFHVPDGLLNTWSGCMYGPESMNVDAMVEAQGNISGDFMNFGFLMLKPFQLNVEKYIGLTDILDDEAKLINFLRMEKWIFGSPD